jgi:hypothetical protein
MENEIPELSFDIYMYIATLSISAWQSMLAIPDFGRFSISDAGKRFSERCHCKPKIEMRSNGTTREVWWLGSWMHRGNDLPAEVLPALSSWYKRGVLHRDGDQPALIFEDGLRLYYQNGVLHRDGDLPARENDIKGGITIWYRNGKRHRDGDKPAYISRDNNHIWYKEGIKIKERFYPIKNKTTIFNRDHHQ